MSIPNISKKLEMLFIDNS